MTAVPTPPDPRTIERLETATADHAITGLARLSYDTQKNRVELKNLVRDVARTVEEFAGVDAAVALRERLENATREITAVQRPASLAVLTDGDDLDSLLLPEAFPACVMHDTRYYVRPLIQSAATHGEFLLLCLAQGEVRLYRLVGEEMSRMHLDGLPGSLPDVVGHEVEGDILKHHVADRAQFHGQGKGEDDRIPELEQFLRAVDQAVTDDPHTREQPLMLAAVDELDARYRQLSRHKHLVSEAVTLSPDQTSEEDLRLAACRAFIRWRERDNLAFRDHIHEVKQGLTVEDAGDVLRAAEEGRIDTLLAGRDQWLWGRFDPREWAVELHGDRREDSRDLVDTAMRATWRHGGRIRVVDDSSRMAGPLEARLRY